FVDTLPDSEKARLTVSVKLLDKTFSNDLTDKSSKKYKKLKTTVVEALKVVLDVKLGPGKYEIGGVTFSSGSIVVKYEVVVPKNESTAMQSNIVAAIKKHNGPFAGSTLDGNYVSTAKTTAVMYYAQFRVPGLDYIDNYGLSGIYKADENVGSRLINITDVTFRKGSVIVDFVLWVYSTVSSKDVLHDILSNAPFRFPWLPVILGVVSAVVVLIIVIVLAVRKCNTNRLSDVSNDVDSQVYRTTFPKQNRLWRQTRPRMPANPKIDPQYQVCVKHVLQFHVLVSLYVEGYT
ncbi:hypothetical protein NP493_66g06032, partial [Ridgeia piscesae]